VTAIHDIKIQLPKRADKMDTLLAAEERGHPACGQNVAGRQIRVDIVALQDVLDALRR
jgi:hypothetical protein